MTTFARGSTIAFSVAFLDKDGEPTVPPSANLYVSYPGGSAVAIIAMSEVSGVFEAQWDSSVAVDAGDVQWHVRAGGSAHAARDGSFRLVANAANPDPP